MRFKRYDKITLDRTKAIRLDNGMMRVPARLSRVGVQEYRKADGSTERAYRPENEVSASAESFDLVPLVNDHPYAEGGVVTADNAKRLSVGTVGTPAFRNGFVEATLLISDAEAVRAVEAGKLELSAGYFMDRDETPGTTPDGQRYDFVQRNIRANHVAIVDAGRAGPEVRIQLDAQSAISVDFKAPQGAVSTDFTATPREKTEMKKITIDGVEVEVTDLAATLIQKERAMASGLLDNAKAEAAKLKTEGEKLKAQCDAANEKVAKLEDELKTAPAKAEAKLAERVALDAKVKAIAPDLKLDAKLDAMAVKRAVCAHAKIACDGKTDDYVSARFDVLAEDAEKKNPATEAAQRELNDPAKKPTTDANPSNPEDARKKAESDFFNSKK